MPNQFAPTADGEPAVPVTESTPPCQYLPSFVGRTGATGEPADIARTLLDHGVGTVLVTMGAEGCAVAQSGQVFSIRPPKVQVIDGYGAGAAFSAGVIYGLLRGWPQERAAQFATAHAGLQCGVTGNAAFSIKRIQRVATNLEIRPNVL